MGQLTTTLLTIGFVIVSALFLLPPPLRGTVSEASASARRQVSPVRAKTGKSAADLREPTD